MTSKLLFFLLISLIILKVFARVDTSDFGEIPSDFDDNSAEFNFGVYKHILNEYFDEPIGFSPLSIQYLFNIAFMGTTDDTYDRLAHTLRMGAWSDLEIAENFQKFLNISEESSTVLKISNKVYIPYYEEIMTEFKEIIENYFNCEIENVDFEENWKVANNINNWFRENTNDQLKNLIDQESLNNNTRMVLVNTINFNGKWDKQFPKGLPYIVRRSDEMEFAHLDDINVKIYKLNFIDTDLSILLILPEEEFSGERNLPDINPFDLRKNIGVTEETVLYHPFRLKSTINLKDILKRMQLEEIYSDSATFDIYSNSPEPLKMSDIYLKVSIEFNSEGMEASALTWSLFSSPEIDAPSHTTDVQVKPEKSAFFALMSKSNIIFAGKL